MSNDIKTPARGREHLLTNHDFTRFCAVFACLTGRGTSGQAASASSNWMFDPLPESKRHSQANGASIPMASSDGHQVRWDNTCHDVLTFAAFSRSRRFVMVERWQGTGFGLESDLVADHRQHLHSRRQEKSIPSRL